MKERGVKTDNEIRTILARKNLKQSWLAQKVDIKREYINRIINGNIQVKVGLAIKISQALDEKVEGVFFLSNQS